ncbi:MAG: LPS assembly protein LptD [Deltaproteobacteria bacterium]|nr:LPS assembly protein LptD [Deltaproteobacteria bacterium]
MTLTDADPPVTIEADEMRHDQQDNRLTFLGRVRLSRGEEEITGDWALWHEPSKTAEISGDVRIRTADFTATAARAAVNMDLKLAKIYDGRAFFPARHYYVEGDVLERQGPETLYANEAIFTTCDGPEPSWRLTVKNLLVNRGGLATATGAKLSAGEIPLAFLPYFAAPVKQDRQTGFLIPSVSNSSRDGFTLAAPFFWELAEDYDLTILPVWRSQRGLAMTLEGRYNLQNGQGIWLGTFLRDKRDNSYQYRSVGNLTRNSRDLFWLRTQNNWQTGEWDLNLDLDLVSDPLFLYAFRNDIDGFTYSQGLFSDYFGRTVNEELDSMRLSTFFAQKKSQDVYFRASLSYIDDLYRRNNVDTLQNLPQLRWSLISRPVNQILALPEADERQDVQAETGVNFELPRLSLDVQYDYFARRTNEFSLVTETGHRLHLTPSLFWRRDLGGAAALRTTAGARWAAYAPTGLRPAAQGLARHSSFENSFSGNFEIELSSSLSRVFKGGPGEAVATIHQIVPTASFEIVEAPSQDELPYWDMLDRRLNRRTFRYGLRNAVVAKNPLRGADGEIDGWKYVEILKVGVFSSYEFASNLDRAEREWARYYATGYFDRGVGPVDVEIEAYMAPGLSTRLISSFDARSGSITHQDISLNLRDNRGDNLSLIYDYDKPSIKLGPPLENAVSQLRGDLVLNLSGGWSTSFSTRYDFEQSEGLETYVRLRYAAQCYGLSLFYSDSYGDHRMGLMIDLLGLGSFGNQAASMTGMPVD